MIGYISGKIIWQHGTSLIVEAGGVGYRIIATPQALEKIHEGQISLFTYLKVAESELTLFGLPDQTSLLCLEKLITVSGVGPKLAMTILSHAEPQNIYSAINNKDAAFFTGMSGVGRKIAEKIIVELQDKIEIVNVLEHTNVAQSDVVAALQSLGYKSPDIRQALTNIDGGLSVTEQIKAALKQLNS